MPPVRWQLLQLPPLSTRFSVIGRVLGHALALVVPGAAAVGAAASAGGRKKLPLLAVMILWSWPPVVTSMVAPGYGLAPPESRQSVPAIEYSGAPAPVAPTR